MDANKTAYQKAIECVGENLSYLRKNWDLTKKEFSDILECDPAMLDYIETGMDVPSLNGLLNLRIDYGINVDHLFISHDLFRRLYS